MYFSSKTRPTATFDFTQPCHATVMGQPEQQPQREVGMKTISPESLVSNPVEAGEVQHGASDTQS